MTIALLSDRFIEVDYEELTRAPEPIIRHIMAACGLAWHEACLRPECNPRAVKTPSKWQARQPICRKLRGTLATLRTLAGASARARRGRRGTGREYRPILIG